MSEYFSHKMEPDPHEKHETPGEWRTFINPISEDRSTRARVFLTNKVPIARSEYESRGAYGTVYSVDVRMEWAKKTYPFALKEFHPQKTEATQEALKNHRHAKLAGLKVWNTYRISEDGTSILMTDGDTDDWEILGQKTTLSKEKRDTTLPFENFEVFLAEYYSQAQKAAQHGIGIAGDVPFLKIRGHNIDFVLGDVDLLNPSFALHYTEPMIQNQNIQNLHTVLVYFLERNFGDQAQPYIDESEHYVLQTFGQTTKKFGGEVEA